MREIKFKVKVIKDIVLSAGIAESYIPAGEWLTWRPLSMVPSWHEYIDEETISEYTGKNGLYENDILWGNEFNHVVVWDDVLRQWWARNEKSGTCFPLYAYRYEDKILGNKFDNPELLEEVKTT